MKIAIAFLLCLISFGAAAQAVTVTDTITVLPTSTPGLDSDGLPSGLIQHGLELHHPATSVIWYETFPVDGSAKHYVVGDYTKPGWVSTIAQDPTTGHYVAHMEWYGVDNQGFYPGTPVPCFVQLDLTFTTHQACSGGHPVCHQVLTIYTEQVQITE